VRRGAVEVDEFRGIREFREFNEFRERCVNSSP
jgi:hypothetical protein